MEHNVITNKNVCFVDNNNTRDSKSTPKTSKQHSSRSSSSSSKQLHSHIIPSPHYDDNNNPSTFVYSDSKHYQGKLMLLDYMIYFFPNEEGFKKLKYNKDYFMIPIYAISSLCEKNDSTKITITTKDRRHITFLTATSEFYTTLLYPTTLPSFTVHHPHITVTHLHTTHNNLNTPLTVGIFTTSTPNAFVWSCLHITVSPLLMLTSLYVVHTHNTLSYLHKCKIATLNNYPNTA